MMLNMLACKMKEHGPQRGFDLKMLFSETEKAA
jgi:hypothetical protein